MAPERVQKISDAVARTLANADVQARIRGLALTPSYADAKTLAALQVDASEALAGADQGFRLHRRAVAPVGAGHSRRPPDFRAGIAAV